MLNALEITQTWDKVLSTLLSNRDEEAVFMGTCKFRATMMNIFSALYDEYLITYSTCCKKKMIALYFYNSVSCYLRPEN